MMTGGWGKEQAMGHSLTKGRRAGALFTAALWLLLAFSQPARAAGKAFRLSSLAPLAEREQRAAIFWCVFTLVFLALTEAAHLVLSRQLG